MRIANPGAVYRSTDPARHLPIARENETGRDAALQAMLAHARALFPDVDPEQVRIYASENETGAVGYKGVAFPYDRTKMLPDGMRRETKARAENGPVFVPAAKTERGKVIRAEMRALSFTPRSLGQVSGVVIITDGTRRWFSSGVIEIIGDDVFAEYHHPIDDEQTGNAKRPSDRARVEADPGWEPIPLSVFYAAREAAS